MVKEVYYKFYNSAGTFLGFVTDYELGTFDMNINGGLSDFAISLPRQFDNFSKDTLIAHGNEVQIWVSDNDAPSGVQIYSGKIEEYSPEVDTDEKLGIRVIGYASLLAQDILKNSTTIKIAYSAQDPSAIMKDIIDKFRSANSGTKLNYGSGTTTISNTGKSVGTTFFTASYADALDLVRQLANYDWYYFFDTDNLLYFRQIASTPTHYFTIGKDLESIRVNSSTLQMINGLIFWNGLQKEDPEYISKYYSDSTSQTAYGRKVFARQDGRFKARTGSADELMNREINAYKNPLVSVTLRVIDNSAMYGNYGYNIESIKPGQTCKVLNVASGSALGSNMLITKVTYGLSYVDLEVANAKEYLDRNLLSISQTASQRMFSESGPSTYS